MRIILGRSELAAPNCPAPNCPLRIVRLRIALEPPHVVRYCCLDFYFRPIDLESEICRFLIHYWGGEMVK